MELTLFSYRRGNSVMHRINAGIKILFLIAFTFFVFWNPSSNQDDSLVNKTVLINLSVCFLISWVCFFLAGANWKSLVLLRFVFVIGLLVTVLKMTDSVKDGLVYGLVYTARFFTTAFLAQTVFETTSMIQIQDSLHLPRIIALSINFIPQIFYEWNKIRLASRARRTKTKNPIKKAAAFLYELESLFFVMLNKAENVRRAVENRINK
ncbi:MAG: energy-coupling factor transporter transmembrane protein EcfT [Treponema sp.]|nr:energy-coupling factor transporter transmembrane protein EcfT [Treponema sp.]